MWMFSKQSLTISDRSVGLLLTAIWRVSSGLFAVRSAGSDRRDTGTDGRCCPTVSWRCYDPWLASVSISWVVSWGWGSVCLHPWKRIERKSRQVVGDGDPEMSWRNTRWLQGTFSKAFALQIFSKKILSFLYLKVQDIGWQKEVTLVLFLRFKVNIWEITKKFKFHQLVSI